MSTVTVPDTNNVTTVDKTEENSNKKRKIDSKTDQLQKSVYSEQGSGVSGVSGFWFTEDIRPGVTLHSQMTNILFNGKSEFQEVQIVTTEPWGKILVLDNKSQSAESDEFIYHESLVHPVMMMHPNPKTVFIGGGGEGATMREILKHKSVEKVVMVDIDKVVCDISREHLSEWSDGAFEDPRVEIHYTCAKKWLENCGRKFDVIIMDIADPIEAGPGIMLYTQEFYRGASSFMNEGAMLVTQSGPGGHKTFEECFTVIHNTLKGSFNNVMPYLADIPSFGCRWAFNIAFNTSDIARSKMDETNIDAMIKTRLDCSKNIHKELRYYDGQTHLRMFHLPKYMRRRMESEKRIMTKENPIFMY